MTLVGAKKINAIAINRMIPKIQASVFNTFMTVGG
jgi:hypothetical protein